MTRRYPPGSIGDLYTRWRHRRPEEPSRRGLAYDPTVDGPRPPTRQNRPHPPANAWPDDAITLTYAELRALVALHLDYARQGIPPARPWEWLALRARAVRDGEAPLLLTEVLDR